MGIGSFRPALGLELLIRGGELGTGSHGELVGRKRASAGVESHWTGWDRSVPQSRSSDSPVSEEARPCSANRSIEFSATTAIPEYDGGEVRIPMEDDAYLTSEGYVYLRPYQTEWYVVR